MTIGSEQTADGGPRGPAASGEQVYQGLRAQILTLDPAAGLKPGPEHLVVWGGRMETGCPRGIATLAALADGTTSLYLSTGGGIIGGGSHQAVATATRSFLADLEHHLPQLQPDPDTILPATGQVIIRALAYTGRMSAEAPEDDLGHGGHQLPRCSTPPTGSSPNTGSSTRPGTAAVSSALVLHRG
jgi:hypothetical protein